MNFVFSGLNIQPPPREKIIQELREIEEEHWRWDQGLGSHVLPIVSYEGKNICGYVETQAGLYSSPDNIDWSKTYQTPALSDYIENHFFNWMSTRGKVHILRTPVNSHMYIHYDCREGSEMQPRPKLRFTLQGDTSDIFFLDSNSEDDKRFCPSVETPFIIDGAWPHAIINSGQKIRYTVTIGSPWKATDLDYGPLLQEPNVEKELLKMPAYSKLFLDKSFNMTGHEHTRVLKTAWSLYPYLWKKKMKSLWGNYSS